MGEEPYFIDQISDYIEDNALDESQKGFNQTILYGKDTDADTIISASRRFPMMGTHQVVILKEAQNLRNLEDDLLSYIESPLNSTILVICYKYKSLDKRKKFAKVAAKNGVLFESKKIYENKVMPWVQEYIAAHNYTIAPKAAALLSDFLGTDLSKIANELDKLMILVKNAEPISPAIIEKNIGISKDYNVFELQNAIGKKDVLKANRIVQYFGSNANNNPATKTISMLFVYFQKILKLHFLKDKSKRNVAIKLGVHEFFVGDYFQAAKNYPIPKVVQIIGILREYDRKSKGFGNVTATSGEIQKELIYKILH